MAVYFESVFEILLWEGFGDHDKDPGQLFILNISVSCWGPWLGNKHLNNQAKKREKNGYNCRNLEQYAHKLWIYEYYGSLDLEDAIFVCPVSVLYNFQQQVLKGSVHLVLNFQKQQFLPFSQ